MRNVWRLGTKLINWWALWGVIVPAFSVVLLSERGFLPEQQLGFGFYYFFSLVAFYLYYVFATYMIVRWREKHISHYGLEYHISHVIEEMERQETKSELKEQMKSVRSEKIFTIENNDSTNPYASSGDYSNPYSSINSDCDAE